MVCGENVSKFCTLAIEIDVSILETTRSVETFVLNVLFEMLVIEIYLILNHWFFNCLGFL